ncbi:MAG: hypothetical protein OXM56_05550, partial [Gammaproteobacteria bacterium]|nr:hypothetical protein [Gammaproteobacteria bacterium]
MTPTFASPLQTGTYSGRLAIMNPIVSPDRSPTDSAQRWSGWPDPSPAGARSVRFYEAHHARISVHFDDLAVLETR